MFHVHDVYSYLVFDKNILLFLFDHLAFDDKGGSKNEGKLEAGFIVNKLKEKEVFFNIGTVLKGGGI